MGHLDPSGLAGAALVATVAAVVFVESGLLIGFFLPGDTVLYGAGLVAHSRAAHVDLAVLVAAAVLAAVAGDALGYLAGRRLGRPVLLRRYPARVLRVERLVDRFGALALVPARFIPWVRTFTPVVVGAGALPYRRFLAANAAGALCWAGGLAGAGWLSATRPDLRLAALAVAAGVVGASALAAAVLLVSRRAAGRRRARPGAGVAEQGCGS